MTGGHAHACCGGTSEDLVDLACLQLDVVLRESRSLAERMLLRQPTVDNWSYQVAVHLRTHYTLKFLKSVSCFYEYSSD